MNKASMRSVPLILLLLVGATTIFATGIAVNPAGAASSAAVIAAAAATVTNPSTTHNEASPASQSRNRNTRATAMTLPGKFFGTFSGVKNTDNRQFAKYLSVRKYDPSIRRYLENSDWIKTFSKSENEDTFDYNLFVRYDDYDNLKVTYKSVVLGKKFIGEGINGQNEEIYFTLQGDHLFEHHKQYDREGYEINDVYEYYFDGELFMQRMSHTTSAVRYFKRASG